MFTVLNDMQQDVEDIKDLIYFKDQYLNTLHFLKTLKLFEH